MNKAVDFILFALLQASIKQEALQTFNSLLNVFSSNIFTPQVSTT
jgi:hypothetical protein